MLGLMTEPMDRRRFLARSLTGLGGAAAVLVAGPEFLTAAEAAPVARYPNLVFDWNFDLDTVGERPRGWTIS